MNDLAFAKKVEKYDPVTQSYYFDESKLLSLVLVSDKVSLEKVKNNAEKYNLPFLCAYNKNFMVETKSLGEVRSTIRSAFQILFLNDDQVTDDKVYKMMQGALQIIFPRFRPIKLVEYDNIVCLNDPELKYFDKSIQEINIDSLMRNMIQYLKDKYGNPNYREYIKEFVEDNHIPLTSTNPIIAPLLDNLPIPTTADTTAPEELNNINPDIINIYTNRDTTDSTPTNKFNFRISLDSIGYSLKPTNDEVGKINNRIGKSPHSVERNNIRESVEAIAVNGQSFSPATFRDGIRQHKHFEQMELFALDFDSGISFDKIKERAEKYNLPILFSYETFSSTEDKQKFRVAFLNDISVDEPRVVKAMIISLMKIFPEADKQCNDISRLYYGGKKLLHFDESAPKINIENLFMSMTKYLRDKHGSTHFKEKISDVSKETGIALNENKLLDVVVTDNIAEYTSGKISPKSIILPKLNNIIDNGENLPTRYYAINFDDQINRDPNRQNTSGKIHNQFRSADINIIREKCQLFREFENGKRWLYHHEQRGIALNLIHIETGKKVFLDILLSNSQYDSYTNKYNLWDYYFSYFKQCNYRPESCGSFCPYKDQCSHGTNILSTIRQKYHTIERLPNYIKKYYPIKEVVDDLRQYMLAATDATGNTIYIIKAQTAIGKTKIYLELIKNSDKKFIIAVPTNILKHDVFRRAAEEMGLNVMVTPSLLEVLQENEAEIPDDIQDYIRKLYKIGKYKAVVPYIKKILKKQDIACLREYLNDLEKIKTFDGHIITTHQKSLTYDEKFLSNYEIIIDEDIIAKAFLPNQETIPLADLRKALETKSSGAEAHKIKQILQYCKKNKKFFKDASVDIDDNDSAADDGDDISWDFDLSSLCKVERFCFLKESKQGNISEDCITFFKPFELPNVKLTIVSATANKDIYRYCCPNRIIQFDECREAEYEGTLLQYYNRPMSRAYLREHINTFDIIKEKYKGCPIITFEQFKSYVDNELLHFGNTEGFDGYAGRDLVVCGTPHYPPFLYVLIAYTIGLPVDLDAAPKANQLVEHNGYRFHFTAFDEGDLRNIQFWMINSELEQAVGRARLLRFDCVVVLFSNFPLAQATNLLRFDWDKYLK